MKRVRITLLIAILLLGAADLFAQQQNFPTVSGGTGVTQIGPNCLNTTNCFFANFDAQMAFTVTCNNASQTIVTGANDPPFVSSDIGKSIAGTTGINAAAGCPPQGTITAFNNAHSVTVSIAATQTTATGTLAWGHNDGAAIQNAFAASLTRNTCLSLAEGAAFFDVPPFLDQRSGSPVGTPPCVKGTGNTRLIPLPSFNYSNCIPNDACVFKWANAANLNPNYAELEDFEVISPGYTLTGTGTNNNVFNLTRVILKNVWLWHWGFSIGRGMQFTGPVSAFSPNSDMSGNATACYVLSSGNNQTVQLFSPFCGESGQSLNVGAGGVLETFGGQYGPGGSPSIQVDGTWSSFGEVMLAATGPAETIRVNGGGKAMLYDAQVVGATGNTAGAINCNVSGGSVSFEGLTTIDGGATGGVTIRSVAGCNVSNRSGGLAKVVTNIPGTFSLSGNSVSTPSETQTGTCAANAATVTFKLTYSLAPLVLVSATTNGSTGAQATATNTTTATIHCNGATDTFVATVIPNPI